MFLSWKEQYQIWYCNPPVLAASAKFREKKNPPMQYFLFSIFCLPFLSYPLMCLFYQVASSLNSSYCYILHNGNTVFTWTGSLTTTVDQELAERMLDLIKVRNRKVPFLYSTTKLSKFWLLLVLEYVIYCHFGPYHIQPFSL